MGIWISSISLQSKATTKLNDYEPTIEYDVWKEINSLSKELDLDCLKYIYFAGDCVFNFFQCQEILEKEIPLLRSKNISEEARKALDGIEQAIKMTYDKTFHAFILFEGD